MQPIIAGPGSMMTVVLLTDDDRFSIPEQAVTAAIMLGVVVATWIVLRLAAPIQRALGQNGVSIMARIMGLILAASAVRAITDGVQASFAG